MYSLSSGAERLGRPKKRLPRGAGMRSRLACLGDGRGLSRVELTEEGNPGGGRLMLQRIF